MDIKVHPRDDDLVIGTHARTGAVFTEGVARLNERLAAAGVPQVVVDREQDERSRR